MNLINLHNLSNRKTFELKKQPEVGTLTERIKLDEGVNKPFSKRRLNKMHFDNLADALNKSLDVDVIFQLGKNFEFKYNDKVNANLLIATGLHYSFQNGTSNYNLMAPGIRIDGNIDLKYGLLNHSYIYSAKKTINEGFKDRFFTSFRAHFKGVAYDFKSNQFLFKYSQQLNPALNVYVSVGVDSEGGKEIVKHSKELLKDVIAVTNEQISSNTDNYIAMYNEVD